MISVSHRALFAAFADTLASCCGLRWCSNNLRQGQNSDRKDAKNKPQSAQSKTRLSNWVSGKLSKGEKSGKIYVLHIKF